MMAFMLFTNFFGLFDYHNITELSQSIVAQSIGKIIEHKWSFVVYNAAGKPIESNQIRLQDRVVVEEGSFVTVLVQDSFTAQVTGPAQFEITIDEQYASVDYRLQFIQWGDFVAINGIRNLDNQISIQTSDGVILRKDANSNQKVAFTVENRNNEKTITNNSSDKLDVMITNETSSSSVSIVASSTVNLVNDNNTMIAVSPSQNQPTQTTKPILSSQPIDNKDNIDAPVVVWTAAKKQSLEDNLYVVFVKNDLAAIASAYLKWDRTRLQVATTNLNNRLHRIATLVEHPTNTSLQITSLISYTDSILSTYRTHVVDYPANYRNLTRIKTYLTIIQNYEYGLFEGKSEITTLNEMIELLPNLSLEKIKRL